MFTATLDTCTLWPSIQRDFLLSLAVEGLYTPRWSELTLEELRLCEIEKAGATGSPGSEAERKASRLILNLREAFPDATVSTEGTVPPAELPDPDDWHVLAASGIGASSIIVTSNLRDFPEYCLPDGVEKAIPPAEFAADTVALSPTRAYHALHAVHTRRRNPPLTIGSYIDILEDRYAFHEAAELLRREHTKMTSSPGYLP